MREYIYPSRDFLKRVMRAIRKGELLRIKVSNGWRKKILLTELPLLLESDESVAQRREEKGANAKDWLFVPRMFFVLRFFTTYLYALTADYKVSFVNSGELTITLEPPAINPVQRA